MGVGIIKKGQQWKQCRNRGLDIEKIAHSMDEKIISVLEKTGIKEPLNRLVEQAVAFQYGTLLATGVTVDDKHFPDLYRVLEECAQRLGINIPYTRDERQCHVLYYDGTPGVSRFHCTLVWDDVRDVFVLADMNSSCGTFPKNGMRLTPGKLYYLKAGESFYLGDMNNEVRMGFVTNGERLNWC